jgi:hypothetical protein
VQVEFVRYGAPVRHLPAGEGKFSDGIGVGLRRVFGVGGVNPVEPVAADEVKRIGQTLQLPARDGKKRVADLLEMRQKIAPVHHGIHQRGHPNQGEVRVGDVVLGGFATPVAADKEQGFASLIKLHIGAAQLLLQGVGQFSNGALPHLLRLGVYHPNILVGIFRPEPAELRVHAVAPPAEQQPFPGVRTESKRVQPGQPGNGGRIQLQVELPLPRQYGGQRKQ